ncbi:MAG: tetratricopeptide repeat protein [Chthoniobacteraceae bacterium]
MFVSRSRFSICAAFLALTAFAGDAEGHGEIHEALAAVTQQIAASPASGGLYLLRGRLHAAHRDWRAAHADYDRAGELDPTLVAVELARGEAWSAAGQPDEAVAALNRYIARQPESAAGYFARARAQSRAGRTEDAAADFALAITRTREPEPAMYLDQSHALVSAGRAGDAIRALDDGIARLGPLGTLVQPVIELERAAGRHAAALGRIERMLATAPRKERWLCLRGEVLAEAGRGAEARIALLAARTALAGLPQDRRSRAAAGLAGRIEAAIAHLDAGQPAEAGK